jgi:hypothetical protein
MTSDSMALACQAGASRSGCEVEQVPSAGEPPPVSSPGAALLFLLLGLVSSALRVAFYLSGAVRPPGALIWAAGLLSAAGLFGLWTGTRRALSAPTAPARLRAAPSQATAAVFIGFLGLYAATQAPPTPYNEHVRLAEALLHGHTWVSAPSYMEHVTVNGHAYLLHPPLSALLLMPLVALLGLRVDQTAVAVVLGAGEIALAWRLTGLLGLATQGRVWLVLFFGAGTTLWYEATLGASWDFALLVGAGAVLLTLNELFGRGRPWLVGALAGLSALARYDLALAWPLWALLLAARGQRLRRVAGVLYGYAFAGVIFVIFNELRFATVGDISFWLWHRQDRYALVRPGGPFALVHLPFNLYTLLFMPPIYDAKPPYIHPQMMGQGLLLTSPAFLLALRPSFLCPTAGLLYLATVLIMVPGLLVYANGFVQFGARYYVQVYPLLLALMALGLGRRADQLTKLLVTASIVLVAYGVWHVRWLGFG